MTSDTRLEVLIGRVLRAGVVASSLCIACGLAIFLVVPDAGSALLNVGILLLIATPAARVVLSIVAFGIERDWPFVALTTIVLAELAASVVAALVFHRQL
jgi:uncharacterized membrane protein